MPKQINLRLDEDLIAKIDARAGRFKLSRNAWITKALSRMVDMPEQVRTEQERF